MTIYNLGSINLDHIYTLPHLVNKGETLAASSYQVSLGGKGANQSIAIARAGGDVVHGGMIHARDEAWLSLMEKARVDVRHVLRGEVPTGHAIIAVAEEGGDNQIIISGGSNDALPLNLISDLLTDAKAGDWALAQNETNLTAEFLQEASKRGLKICYSAAPFIAERAAELLPLVDLLIVNEVEAKALQELLGHRLEVEHLFVTKGAEGSEYLCYGRHILLHSGYAVDAVDTAGAGDTYLGYILALLDIGIEIIDAMDLASKASALQVTRRGTAEAIPSLIEVRKWDTN